MAVPFQADVAGLIIYFEGRDFPLLFSHERNIPWLLLVGIESLSKPVLWPGWRKVYSTELQFN